MNIPPLFTKLGICDSAVDDADLRNRIQSVCPTGTYTSIYVRTMNHQFLFLPESPQERSRLIQFEPTNSGALWNALCIIFKSTVIEPIDLSRTVLGLLGSTHSKDRQNAHSAYWQNFTIKLYVSMRDGLSFDIEESQGVGTRIAMNGMI
jgi:hypothetical protein